MSAPQPGRVHLDVDREQHVARLTIDRPERKNAYDPPMREQMREYLHEVADDDDVKVLILRGADGVFSTGADMANAYAWYGGKKEERRPSQRRRLAVDRVSFGFYHDFLYFPKVTVAQVETYALGGGFELALMATSRSSAAVPGSACPARSCSGPRSAISTSSSTASARY